jgi:hypothetical protein
MPYMQKKEPYKGKKLSKIALHPKKVRKGKRGKYATKK